jgi:hypothetical protein
MGPNVEHIPELVDRPDGRHEIICPQWEHVVGEVRPIGIGLPITSRFKAESNRSESLGVRPT